MTMTIPKPLMSSESELISLRDGLSVPLSALRVLWDLEYRGLQVELSDHGTLLIGPGGQLTGQDREAIRRHRDELIQLVDYCSSEVVA